MCHFTDGLVKIIHRFILGKDRFPHQWRIIIRIALILGSRLLIVVMLEASPFFSILIFIIHTVPFSFTLLKPTIVL